MDAGKLNRPVTFYKMDNSHKNEADEIDPKLMPVFMTWANITTSRQSSVDKAGKPVERINYMIKIRYRPSVKENYTVCVNQSMLTIDSICNENEAGIYLIIEAHKE